MTVKTSQFDASEYLDDPEMIAEYLSDALEIAIEEDNYPFFARALGNVAKARGISEIARLTGLGRESLYKTISGESSPKFETISRVLRALDLSVSVEPSSNRDDMSTVSTT